MSTSTAPDAPLAQEGALEEVRAPRFTPNRIVAAATALLGVATVLAGMLADLGAPAQVTAIAAGALVVLTPAVVWLKGWQAFEARQGDADGPLGWDDAREALEAVVARERERQG